MLNDDRKWFAHEKARNLNSRFVSGEKRASHLKSEKMKNEKREKNGRENLKKSPMSIK